GPVTVALLVGAGLYLTLRLRLIQIFRLWLGLRIIGGLYDKEEAEGELSHFRALSVALAATIGNGNIAGVATAIAAGGPGAVFWMWVTAVVGMATKYVSCTLAVIYRDYSPETGFSGGPMQYIEKGLGPKWKPLAQFFAFCAVLSAFGTGNMTQSNSVADTLEFSIRDIAGYGAAPDTIFLVKLAIGLVFGGLVWAVLIGGVTRIGAVAAHLVPAMCIVYVLGAVSVMLINIDLIPGAIEIIFTHAFTGTAATGGFLGASVMAAIRFGVSRGIYSNEAGLGTAPIAHATARTREPVREGLVAMTGPFIDTIIVCSMTALVIITTGAWTTGKTGSELTTVAFNAGIPELGKITVSLSMIFFSFSSTCGWSYYGDRSMGYLFGARSILWYRYV
ncbi:MAG: sodium:alanine symporter family protein, partial [Alphaproteobacteria bacterium]|nr:sodium:alanine symporter family protein [Alphaproteobacteria bacterium]